MPPSTLQSRGMTLIEVAVSLVVLAVLGYLVARFVIGMNRADRQERLTLQAQQEVRRAMDTITQELRLADPQQIRVPGWVAGVHPQGDGAGEPHWNRIQFRWWGWDDAGAGGLGAPEPSPWVEYVVAPDPVIPNQQVLQRLVYTDNPPVTVGETTTICRNIFSEDANGNGILDPGEDLNGDGILQPGLWFEVDQEDTNGDGVLPAAEDTNGNGHFDGHVLVRVSTQVVNGFLRGNAQLVSSAQCRGGRSI